jgi:hypothetical protein
MSEHAQAKAPPVHVSARRAGSVSLLDFPDELLLKIFASAAPEQRATLAATSRHLHALYHDRAITARTHPVVRAPCNMRKVDALARHYEHLTFAGRGHVRFGSVGRLVDLSIVHCVVDMSAVLAACSASSTITRITFQSCEQSSHVARVDATAPRSLESLTARDITCGQAMMSYVLAWLARDGGPRYKYISITPLACLGGLLCPGNIRSDAFAIDLGDIAYFNTWVRFAHPDDRDRWVGFKAPTLIILPPVVTADMDSVCVDFDLTSAGTGACGAYACAICPRLQCLRDNMHKHRITRVVHPVFDDSLSVGDM